MFIHPLNEAQSNLSHLINEAAISHQPVVITSKDHNAVLLSEEDWSSIQETLHLLSVPGIRESIKEGLATLISDCDEALDW
ncbi:MAG: type II toxin-antitoxin system Phd/YefM family antitoxin [Cyanobacteria bacterium P01_C01_bin.69]